MMSVLIGIALAMAQASPTALPLSLPAVDGAQADATCGGLEPLAAIATCVATTQGSVETVIAAFETDFRRQGWNAAEGEGARVVYVRRSEAGGCDAVQMLAVGGDQYDVAGAPVTLALAAIPGDYCSSSQ